MKHLEKIIGLVAGFAMAIAVGAGIISSNASKTIPVHAADELCYTLDGSITGGTNGYATSSDIEQSDIHWDVVGNTTTNPWRIGGKNLSGVDRTVTSKSAITTSNISKVIVSTGTKTLSAVNSITINLGSAESGTDLGTKTFSSNLVSANLEFVRPDNKTWTNAYITVIFNVNAAGSNQYIQLLSIKVYIGSACAHNWDAGVIHAATCEEGGYTEYTCSLCGATKHEDEVAALGHNYGEWIIDTAATCTTEGSKHRVCSRDSSHIENEVIPATGHNYVDGICEVCGAEEPVEEYHLAYTKGTNGSDCTVNDHVGIKLGTSSKGGDMTITIPAGTTKIKVYAAAWNGVTGLALNITGATANPSTINLTANSGIANNSPFTLSEGVEETDFRFIIELSGISTETVLTFATSTTKRCVIWGATDLFAESYASEFTTKITCNSAGTSEPTYASGYNWLSFRSIYNNLDAEEKGRLVSPDNQTLLDATARYDYIVGKYNPTGETDPTKTNYAHYITGRTVTPLGSARVMFDTIGLNSSNNIIIITIITLISLTSLSLFLIYRKKHQ